MNDGRVVSSTKLLADRWERDAEIFTEDVHDYLAGTDDFFAARLVIYAFLVDIIEIGYDLDDILDRYGFLGFGAVLQDILDLVQVHSFLLG